MTQPLTPPPPPSHFCVMIRFAHPRARALLLLICPAS